MPRAKRYFPVSHDINEDPEIWELTDLFGDRSLRVWLEVLRILDKNENTLKVCDHTVAALSRKCRQTVAKVRRILGHAVAKTWLHRGDDTADDSSYILKASNYAKYHKTSEHKGNQDVSPPKLTITKQNITKQHKNKDFPLFWEKYPKKKSKGDAEKAWAALNPDELLQNRIFDALEQAKTSDEWTKDMGKFIPHPATWLRRRGWEDEFFSPDDPMKRFLENDET